ncbi:50S ribosomal protein L6, partial [Candidatus Aerophobetes bacterium]|nr:50S ribosomal protein L6 [Candidatus Aerophobetes bacterium]
SLHGTLRSLIFNMVKGVSEEFEKVLEVVGMGYKATLENGVLTLRVGYSHLVRYTGPEDVGIEVPNPNTIRVFGCDKQKVGEVAAEIRAVKKPEPYKGKGIRYKGEVIRRKVGKAALVTK